MISWFEKLPDGFSRVVPVLKDKLVVAIGGGPSLTEAQVLAVQKSGVPCVAINDAYLWAPFADVLYASDQRWWDDHVVGFAKPIIGLTAKEVAARFLDFKGERCTIQPPNNKPNPYAHHTIKNRNHPHHGFGLSTEPDKIITGHNGGWQVINILSLARARVIVLLGYDGQASRTGKSHWSGGHRRPTSEAAYEQYRRACSQGETPLKAAGVTVVNASPDSVIGSFAKMTIGEALCL